MKSANITPSQITGSESGAKESIEAVSIEEAIQLFEEAKLRLSNINSWGQWSGKLGASFKLTDEKGDFLNQFPKIGNLIRIDISGPGPEEGNGFDWVIIEEIIDKERSENDDLFAFRVRPVKAPGSNDKSPAHFYTTDATSSFIVKRKGKIVTASEEGRNEIANTKTENIIDKIRNAIIGTGAKNGMAHLQWKTFIKGILEKK